MRCVIVNHSRDSPAKEGRHAIVTVAGRDAVDADVTTDERDGSGRRRRVVLMPRRWHQVDGKFRRRGWQKSPVARESAQESVKTIARGMPGDFRCDLTNACVAFYRTHCTRGYRAHRAPGIPCALP